MTTAIAPPTSKVVSWRRGTGLAVLALACAPGPPPPQLRLVLSASGPEIELINEDSVPWEYSLDHDFDPLLMLQTEDGGGWVWSHSECPHQRDEDWDEIAPGERVPFVKSTEEVPRGRHRWIAWVRRPGGPWREVPSPPFAAESFMTEYAPWEGWHPEWDDGASIVITEVRSRMVKRWNGEHPRFDLDVRIENRLEVELEYNPSSNYWLCEGFGGWARHPGFTICGNQASWPRIPPGGSEEHLTGGKGFGRFRFGMLFQEPHRGRLLAAALSEPFVVEPPAEETPR